VVPDRDVMKMVGWCRQLYLDDTDTGFKTLAAVPSWMSAIHVSLHSQTRGKRAATAARRFLRGKSHN
jgi:hypothetical protein